MNGRPVGDTRGHGRGGSSAVVRLDPVSIVAHPTHCPPAGPRVCRFPPGRRVSPFPGRDPRSTPSRRQTVCRSSRRLLFQRCNPVRDRVVVGLGPSRRHAIVRVGRPSGIDVEIRVAIDHALLPLHALELSGPSRPSHDVDVLVLVVEPRTAPLARLRPLSLARLGSKYDAVLSILASEPEEPGAKDATGQGDEPEHDRQCDDPSGDGSTCGARVRIDTDVARGVRCQWLVLVPNGVEFRSRLGTVGERDETDEGWLRSRLGRAGRVRVDRVAAGKNKSIRSTLPTAAMVDHPKLTHSSKRCYRE